jgi:hypothetical protein
MSDSQQVNPSAATATSGTETLAAGSNVRITPKEDEASTLSEVMLSLSDIKVDTSIQCRVSINRKTVDEYAACMKNGDIFPPLDAFNVEGGNLLADGFQRIEAARQAEFKSISIRIRPGTRKDAVKFAIEANRAHGVRLSNKDKRRAVQLSFQELADLSDGAIAQLVGVSQPFVSKMRGQLKSVMSPGARTGRDGRKRNLPKMNQKNVTAKSTNQSTGSTDEQAHNADAGHDSEDQTTDENATSRDSTQKNEYDFDNAWHQIKNVLLAELEKCPEHLRSHFCQKLCDFAANASGKASGATPNSTENLEIVIATVASTPAGAAGSPKAGSATPAKVEARRKAKATTVQDVLSKLSNGLSSITAELRHILDKHPDHRRFPFHKAREESVTRLEGLTTHLALIVTAFRAPGGKLHNGSASIGEFPFSTKIVPRGSRLNRVRHMTEIVTALAKSIEGPAPKVAQELGNLATALRSREVRLGL